MARVYATPAQYEDYTGKAAPSNVDALLRLSSRVVDALLVGVVYDTDADGYPTDADVTQALADATCAVARESSLAAVLSGGRSWDTAKIGNVSLSGGSGSSVVQTSVGGVPVPGDALTSLDTVGVRLVVSS